MLPEPTNCWTRAEAAVADALAHCASFRELVGASDATAAAEKVFGETTLDGVLDLLGGRHADHLTPDEIEQLPAYAQVYSNFSQPTGRVGVSVDLLEPFGTIAVWVERQVATADAVEHETTAELERWFKNLAGNLLHEIPQRIAQHGGPFLRAIEIENGPGFNPEDDRRANGLWQGVEYSIAWGLGQE